jgi:hypothetical protein
MHSASMIEKKKQAVLGNAPCCAFLEQGKAALLQCEDC